MKMTKEELTAKLEAHAKWLNPWFKTNIEGKRADLTGADLTDADLTGADLTGADLTRADLNIRNASPYVYDALNASFAAQMAMKKTRIEWEKRI